MPLLRDPRGIPNDPRRYDQIVSEQLEGVSGRSEEFSTTPYVMQRSSDDFYGDEDTSDYFDQDVVLTQIHAQLKPSTTARSIRATFYIGGRDVFRFEGDRSLEPKLISIPLPNWEIKKGEKMRCVSQAGSGGTVTFIVRFFGYPV